MSVGATNRRTPKGVTLLELMIVMALMALVAGVGYPSLSAGLTTLRLRSATNAIAAFLTQTVDRADRTQQAIELVIAPQANVLTAQSSDSRYREQLDLPQGIQIIQVLPPLLNAPANLTGRRFVIYPGGPAPRIGIEIEGGGVRRVVSVDPLTGFPRVEAAR